MSMAPIPKMGTIHIGIDPGRNTGFAVWLKKIGQRAHFQEVCAMDFWKVINRLEEFLHVISKQWDMRLVVTIEASYLNKSIHASSMQHISGTPEQKLSRLLSVAQDVGSMKRETTLLIAWLADNGIQTIEVRPSKTSNTKMTAARFNQLTGWKAKSNVHGRDAAMLVWGK